MTTRIRTFGWSRQYKPTITEAALRAGNILDVNSFTGNRVVARLYTQVNTVTTSFSSKSFTRCLIGVEIKASSRTIRYPWATHAFQASFADLFFARIVRFAEPQLTASFQNGVYTTSLSGFDPTKAAKCSIANVSGNNLLQTLCRAFYKFKVAWDGESYFKG